MAVIEYAEFFRAILNIYSNQSLTLIERHDKINEYWGIGDVVDDFVLLFQDCLLSEIIRENKLTEDA